MGIKMVAGTVSLEQIAFQNYQPDVIVPNLGCSI